MDKIRYTASGRLGIWDTFYVDREKFVDPLESLLQQYSNASIEADNIKFVPTDDSTLASITAICDKIIARGNPTYVDFDFEKSLLKGPCSKYFQVDEIDEGPSFGFHLQGFQLFENLCNLLFAAQDLLILPFWNSGVHQDQFRQLSPELSELTSEEEDIFFERFIDSFGSALGAKLHRQVLIHDLVNHSDDQLVNSRVDFVLHVGTLKWIFEIDGAQHEATKQKDLDEKLRRKKSAVGAG